LVSPVRSDAFSIWVLAAASLALFVATAAICARGPQLPIGSLGVYFDGSLYIEIARSFPLPYGDQAIGYAGHAPGYPLGIALVRLATPDSWLDWGGAALIASWLPAVASVALFFALARSAGLAPIWPTLAFATLHPRWLLSGSAASAESLALAGVVASLLAFQQRRPGLAMLALALASTARYPALLVGIALAAGWLLFRRDRRPSVWAWLSLPPLLFAATNAYLYWRVDGFTTVKAAHSVHWQASFVPPFSAFIEHADLLAGSIDPFVPAAYAMLVVFGLALVVGWRSRRCAEALGDLRGVLLIWIAVIVGFHVCLSGPESVWDFTRLTLLAWPAAVLLLWPAIGERAPRALLVAACVGMTLLGMRLAKHTVDWAALLQHKGGALERLQDDEPRWLHFGALESRSR
jgi:hypothetical protein